MVLACRKKLGLTIADVYFFDDENITFNQKPDIVFYLQSREKKKRSADFYTLSINLQKDEDELFSDINNTTRYHIRKAINQDNVRCILFRPTYENILEFSDYYNVFASFKGIPKCNVPRLRALSEQNALFISKALDKDNKVLCCHAYVIDEKRARSLYSASHFRGADNNDYRALIGRANKFLHWNDIITFKKEGLLVYDFGGIVTTEEKDVGLQNITRFKMAFGGEISHEYNLIEGRSIIGKIAVEIYNVIRKFIK